MTEYKIKSDESLWVTKNPEMIDSKTEVVQCSNLPSVGKFDRKCTMEDCARGCVVERIKKRDEEIKFDMVNHPPHYTSGKIEVKDFIRDQKLNFFRGNCVKYVARAGKKDPAKEIEDLEKAIWYLQDEVNSLKQKQNESHNKN